MNPKSPPLETSSPEVRRRPMVAAQTLDETHAMLLNRQLDFQREMPPSPGLLQLLFDRLSGKRP